jgi:hypothetical protein
LADYHSVIFVHVTRYEAYIGKNWKDLGLATVLVARIRVGTTADCGVFLVDLFCLGIKDAIYETDLTESQLRDFIETNSPEEKCEPLHPACAKKVIEGAAAYAANYGFAPHREYRKARRVLSGVDASTCPEVFVFGENGRPCYVRGPDDSEERVDRVLAMLEMKCGIDGFTFVDAPEDEEEDALLARGMLMDWLDDEADEVPRFYEVSGMMTAMQLCPDKPGLANMEEAQEFLNILKDYWNEIVGLVCDTLDPKAPPDTTCVDVCEDNFETDDTVALFLAMSDWAAGFLRATELWPSTWGAALNRPDLVPHWELLRCMAKMAEPGNLDRIEQMAAETPPRNIGRSVAILARALRPPMPR